MKLTKHNELKYNLFMDYKFEKNIDKLWDEYEQHPSFNFRDKKQLYKLLNVDWKLQEERRIKNSIIKFHRKIRSQIAREKREIRIKQHEINKANKFRKKLEKEIQNEMQRRIVQTLDEYRDCMNRLFENMYGYYSIPIF